MKWLAVDTSTLVLGVAILDEGRLLGEVTTHLHKNHSVRLMPTVARLMEDLDLTPQELEAIAVAGGPGSYTGVRIGYTSAKTMAWSLGIPLYSVSSLAVLAMNGFHFPGEIIPLFDARRDRVYTGLYGMDKGGVSLQLPERVINIDYWLEELKGRGPILFLGEDAIRFKERILHVLGDDAHFGLPVENIPRASALGMLAYTRFQEGAAPEPEDGAPNYLQLAEAEAKWLQKQGNGGEENGASTH
ncbi:tRNA (adenosine(37)-N6)-threonylcarbamoyltransferase complex dimerization subunit type 1 TsaB [Marininema halotolerans]|uniref:tRNA threonylcarbamoyladenosine biosynthesis protein TsaB n=1 Tax=Marininema halotolerans TaxID=1155944 RepID=A0A1I6TMK9_9BACL|nr:tRNA (adenosine(37)-N6)-threonylcarbamoyltransferase complex dimerization subunit type 1 TsaB [Marininema halotolerans]SFS90371.1 tRNA threonylcarbamoyladenosine biosynthesis protein TsaB [Marininema halotolerans]